MVTTIAGRRRRRATSRRMLPTVAAILLCLGVSVDRSLVVESFQSTSSACSWGSFGRVFVNTDPTLSPKAPRTTWLRRTKQTPLQFRRSWQSDDCTARNPAINPTQHNSGRSPFVDRTRPCVFRTLATKLRARSQDGRSTNKNRRRRNDMVLHPLLQFIITLTFYAFHMVVLQQRSVVFPFQIIPNDKGHFTGMGYDSIAGIIALTIFSIISSVRRQEQRRLLADSRSSDKIRSSVKKSAISFPWNVPRDNIRFRASTFVALALLIQAYFWTGRFSIFWEDIIYNMSGMGFYITAPMQRSLTVLLGHLSWVVTGASLLRWIPRPPKFFAKGRVREDDGDPGGKSKTQSRDRKRPYRWYQSQLSNTNWFWWTIGGYYVSSWLFNIADVTNQYILPAQVLEEHAQESVVAQLVNPEHNDLWASLVGYIAPCLSAPWWEEILYRGFLLPLLTQVLGFRSAVFWQGVVFSAHHMSITAALPLAVLGWTWAILYTNSGNLWTVVLLHALWNSRVFFGSWLGL